MRITLSTPRRLARARATRRPRSSRIGAVDGVILAMANPTATARMGNQITSPMVDAMADASLVMGNQISSPMVDAMAGVQVEAEAANNASIGLVRQISLFVEWSDPYLLEQLLMTSND